MEQQTGVYALEEASTQLANDLMGPILERWRTMVIDGRTVELVLHDVRSYAQLADLENTLRYAIKGVKKLQQRNFDSGVALYEMHVQSRAGQIARELEVKDLGSFTIKIESVTLNRIEATLVNP